MEHVVYLYGTHGCPKCSTAMAYLNNLSAQYGVKVEEVFLDDDTEALRRVTEAIKPQTALPVLQFRDDYKCVGPFSDITKFMDSVQEMIAMDSDDAEDNEEEVNE